MSLYAFYNNNGKTERAGVEATLQARIREVLSSNIGRDTGTYSRKNGDYHKYLPYVSFVNESLLIKIFEIVPGFSNIKFRVDFLETKYKNAKP
jgi:hypothetical protein